MPTLIKGIISPVTDPLLTLTAAGANHQPGECSHALCAIVSSPLLTVVASQSFPADASLRPRSTPINANQFHQFLLSHVSSSSVTCFHKRSREEPHSVHGRGSGTQLTGVPGLVDTGTGPPRPGEQPEGACLLSSCFVLPHLLYASCPVYCCSPAQRQLRHRPIRPFRGSVGSSRNRSQGFMEFIGLKEVYGVFREGLWGRRQRANCWVVAGEQTRPHTSATPLLVGGQCGQIVEVWYIGHCHPRSRTILTFHTHKLHSGS